MIKKMNNKGFTLIELLATIVVLGIISSVTIVAVTNYYKNSKEKTEEIFVSQVEKYISDYISLYGSGLTYAPGGSGEYKKCHIGVEGDEVCTEVTLSYTGAFIEAVASNIVKGDLINPSTEEKCTNDNTELSIYRDNDFVYCFKLEAKAGTTPCMPSLSDGTNLLIDTCSNIFKEAE